MRKAFIILNLFCVFRFKFIHTVEDLLVRLLQLEDVIPSDLYSLLMFHFNVEIRQVIFETIFLVVVYSGSLVGQNDRHDLGYAKALLFSFDFFDISPKAVQVVELSTGVFDEEVALGG